MSWADARRPVPRLWLWIRSAEGVGAGGLVGWLVVLGLTAL